MTASLTIRPAVVDDAAALFDAHQDSVRHLCAAAYSTDQLRTWFEDRTPDIHRPALEAGQIVLAEQAGRVLGFVGFVAGEITLLFVRPEAAGSGLGSRLFTLAVERAAQGHGGPLTVVATRNSRGFYEKHGFRVTEESFFVRGASLMRFEVFNMHR